MRMKHLVSLAALAAALACGSAQAQTTVKVGVMSDMSSLYSDIGGPGPTAAAKLAIADLPNANPHLKVELLHARHQKKHEVGPGIVHKWVDSAGVELRI